VEAIASMLVHRTRRLISAGFALALFGIVLGGKWATIDRFGTDMPDWDQWDSEATHLLTAWFEDDNFVAHLLLPHNEHRVILTKLQNLGLTLLNGQWDARLQTVTNAMLHAALAVGFWVFARRTVARRWHAPLFVLTALLFGMPVATQNVLGGFHSQQYWLLGLSFLALTTWPFVRLWSPGWWIGTIAAILALGSMASGFFAAAVVAAIIVFRILRHEMKSSAAWPTLLIATALILVGLVTRVDLADHAHLKARSIGEFFLYILRSLAWPLRGQDWTGALLWCPWLLILWRTLFLRPASAETRRDQTIVALGGWVLLQLIATAYARGADANYPASRYTDTVVFGAMVNALALAALLSPPANETRAGDKSSSAATGGTPRFDSAGMHALGGVWLLAFGIGLYVHLERSIRTDLPNAKKYYVEAERHMRGYLATNDPAQLAFPDIPYPNAEALIERLSHSSLREVMPVVMRQPLTLQAAPDVSPVFRENNASQLRIETEPRHGLSPTTAPLASLKTLGSFTAEGGAAATGVWISSPVVPTLHGWLKIETAGQLGQSGTALELHDAETGVLLADVRANKTPGDAWRAAYVRTPRRPFVLVAKDTDPTRWLAFSAPVEMGALSYRAWQAAKSGMLLVWLSASATLVLLLATFIISRVHRETSKMFSLSRSFAPPETSR
jgi:hypothetical protein